MWVRTNIVNLSNPNIRMLIRGWEENSFITQQGSNYFYTLTSPVRMSAGDWQYLSGTVDVLASDISANTGIFTLALDYLGTADGQLLYIDDFCVEKETVGTAYLYFEKSLYHFKPYRNSGNAIYSVKAHVYPPNADDQDIRYESSNTLVVSINEKTGQVFTGAPGNATITAYLASNPDKRITCQISVKYELSVRHYYDQGLVVRRGDAVGGITDNQQFTSEILEEVFGLEITTNFITTYSSTADRCKGTVTSANLDTMCTNHNPSCSNSGYMYYDFHNNHDITGNTNVIVFWSGHRTDREGNNAEEDANVNRSCYYRDDDGSANIMMLNNDDTFYRNRYTLLHETAHAIGAPDHYHEEDEAGNCKNSTLCSECGGSNKRPEACTMNITKYYAGAKKNYFCAECREDMRQHLAEHH